MEPRTEINVTPRRMFAQLGTRAQFDCTSSKHSPTELTWRKYPNKPLPEGTIVVRILLELNQAYLLRN